MSVAQIKKLIQSYTGHVSDVGIALKKAAGA